MKKLKAILCVLFGHPPVIDQCFGYQYCVRCRAQVGDSLGGVGVGETHAVEGHSCDKCAAIWNGARWIDRFLTPNPLTKPVLSKELADKRVRAERDKAMAALQASLTEEEPR